MAVTYPATGPMYRRGVGEATTAHARALSKDSAEDLSECIAAWGARSGSSASFASTTRLRPPSEQSMRQPVYPPMRPRALSGSPQSSRVPSYQVPGPSLAVGDSCGAGGVITLSVGGRLFMASPSTLRKAPFFENLLQAEDNPSIWGRKGTAAMDEATGRLFVDRSAELFGYILEFLRSGRWLLRENARDVDFVAALRDEASFYGMFADLPIAEIVEYATVWQFRDDTSIYVDCGEQMIREDPDNQGLFRLCRYSGSLPLDQQSGTRRFKATSQGIQAVISYFAMRGFSVTHVVEGSLLTHQTSADGQGRTGPAVQYVLSRQATPPETSASAPACQGFLLAQSTAHNHF